MRVAKNGAVKKNKGRIAVGFFFPRRRNQRLVFPKCLKDLGIQTDIARILQPLEFFFAFNPAFIFLEHVLKKDIGKVYLIQGERTLILLINSPALAQELYRVKRRGTVNENDFRFTNNHFATA